MREVAIRFYDLWSMDFNNIQAQSTQRLRYDASDHSLSEHRNGIKSHGRAFLQDLDAQAQALQLRNVCLQTLTCRKSVVSIIDQFINDLLVPLLKQSAAFSNVGALVTTVGCKREQLVGGASRGREHTDQAPSHQSMIEDDAGHFPQCAGILYGGAAELHDHHGATARRRWP
jgi:hypothetical protein